MRRRRGDTHRLLRWLWTSRGGDARAARLVLLPASALWRGTVAARAEAYRRGWWSVRPLPLPAVAVGNLTAGGSGRTAVTTWIAQHYLGAGLRPAVLTVGSPGVALAAAHALPGAIVIDRADRRAAAADAAAQGAAVLVLDDASRELGIGRDLDVAVISAETSRAVRWVLPAGPWREDRAAALARAGALIITRRRAPLEAAEALARELAPLLDGPVAIAHLGLTRLEGLVSGTGHPASALAGRRVVAATGLPDPDAFVAHVKRAGGAVQVATWRDQPELRDEDVAWLAHAARRADHVVITERDAVRLRDRWPANVPEPLVAVQELTWERNGPAIAERLDAVAALRRR